MAQERQVGDAFGEILLAALSEARDEGLKTLPSIGPRAPRPVVEIVERDDGFIRGAPAAWYLAGPSEWWPSEQRALEQLDGRTLDIGAGGVRLALALQERDIPVTALDTSPGAIDVARSLGVRQLALETVEAHAKRGYVYDSFALFGNNLGLLGPRDQAPLFLGTLASMARPGSRIIAQGTNPYFQTTDPLHAAYQERNRVQGRLPGLYRQRVRYRDLTTAYLDYLLCSAEELEDLVKGSDWEMTSADTGDAPIFIATLTLKR